jgi:flavin reductase (DIM6/NTAB) family NADH-FMN oxidoreductase RutF
MSITTAPQRIDGRALRHAYGHFPTGVVAVCAEVAGTPRGMAVSAFVPVSLDPPLLAICIQKSSTTWPQLREADGLGISVLSRGQQTLALQLSAKDSEDRFVGADFAVTASGAILIAGSEIAFACVVEQVLDGGDHSIVLLRVEEIIGGGPDDPMVFHASSFAGLRHHRSGQVFEPDEFLLW